MSCTAVGHHGPGSHPDPWPPRPGGFAPAHRGVPAASLLFLLLGESEAICLTMGSATDPGSHQAATRPETIRTAPHQSFVIGCAGSGRPQADHDPDGGSRAAEGSLIGSAILSLPGSPPPPVRRWPCNSQPFVTRHYEIRHKDYGAKLVYMPPC
jgi:hypothetical protein